MCKEYKFDKNLRALLKDCKMSQKDLAQEIGSNESVINRWLNDKSYPSMLLLLQVADFFCVTLDDLVYGEIN